MKKVYAALILAAACLPGFSKEVRADEHTWTLDADFDEGTVVNLNHDPNHDQLQLNNLAKPFRYINVAASARGTVVRVDTDTGEIVGEYKSAPEGRGLDPSRTSVDLRGNVWTANRGEAGEDKGSAVKIGIVVGGTRCNADGSPNPDGEYVWLDPAQLTYSTCVDRDGDGLIRTSKGLGDILSWSDITDGEGGPDGIVEDAEDECILVYQRLPDAPNPRHVSVDKGNADGDGDVWVAGHPYEQKMFYKLDGETGALIDSFDSRVFGCGGYGGLISNNVLWSSSVIQRNLLRYDLATKSGQCISLPGLKGTGDTSYGLGVDNDEFIWNSLWADDTITKINPTTGIQVSGFPVPSGGEYSRGVAVTPKDNHIWVANSYEQNKDQPGTVSRIDVNGNVLALIPVGKHPTGVAVDYRGKVWVTNRQSDNIMRIDPATNAVDLTVDLGAGAGPYNYSDMTGQILLGHPPIGFWDVVYDGGCNTLWDRISWTGDEDAANNGEIKVEVRAALTKAGLASVPFTTVSNGDNLTGMKGRFMEVRTTLTTKAPVGERDLPLLRDLTVEYSELDMTVDIPDLKYSFGFAPFDLDDYIAFNSPGDWYDDVIWSHSPVPEGWNVTIDENNVVTVTCPEDETEDVPITFYADLEWGGEGCGVSEEVLFEANHPPELCDTEPPCLWVPNHKNGDENKDQDCGEPTYFQCDEEQGTDKKKDEYRDICLNPFVCDQDGDLVTASIVSITSDEPTKINNGDKAPDADPACIGTDTALLRVERAGCINGKVYMVTFLASDGRGGESELTLPVKVPHDCNHYKDNCSAENDEYLFDAIMLQLRFLLVRYLQEKFTISHNHFIF